MGNYKGIDVPNELLGVIEHMKGLEEDREEISILSQQWDLLTVLGQMTGSSTDMSKTREEFKTLTAKLLNALGTETLHKTVQSLTGKAQVTVDIVIRNLFERTADIGFLATDDDIRSFIRASAGDNADNIFNLEVALKTRFTEYTTKYSVYENIILLDPDGRLLCQLDETNKIETPDQNLVKMVRETSKEYVETFGKTEFCPKKENALLYSFRVRESNDLKSPVIGILCLVFRFENELEGVFQNLLTSEDWTVLTLLDSSGKVIATSDHVQVPVNSKQDLAIDEKFKLTRFAGRLYLSKTCVTKGYQGFTGLGWYGHAMIPVDQAFSQDAVDNEKKISSKVLQAVMEESKLFSEQVRTIPRDAESIQSELDRAVWNGNLGAQANSNASLGSSNKVLLWEISVTGSKTKNVFERSINELQQTVVNSILTDMRFASSLAIDIMDRNLYERANDCRWWSLTTSFQETLASEEKTPADLENLAKVLSYINGLYTVYTNLFIYDKNGEVLAVSNSTEKNLVGKTVTDELTRSVLSLKSSQKYRVSSFQPTPFYNQRPTYIYGAPIMNKEGTSVLGGISIVFDGEPQFRQILEDSLPRDKSGNIPEGCFSIFTDRKGVVISSTSQKYLPMSQLDINESFLNIKNGDKASGVIEISGQYYAVGACCSKGYREFKGSSDEYKNDIIALTFTALGKMSTATLDREEIKPFTLRQSARVPGKEYIDVATFHIGSIWIGVSSDSLEAAIISDKITRVPTLNKAIKGLVMFGEKPLYLIEGYESLGVTKLSTTQNPQVVVIKTHTGPVGLVVDKLGEIPFVAKDQISKDYLVSSDDNASYIKGIVRLESNSEHAPILVIVEPTEFIKCLLGGALSLEMLELMKEAKENLKLKAS